MTFTRKAATSFEKRLFRAGIRDVRAGTFHRMALGIVTQYREDQHSSHSPRAESTTTRRGSRGCNCADSGDLKLEEWQLPRVEQEIGWALSQASRRALRESARPTSPGGTVAAQSVRRSPRSLRRTLLQSWRAGLRPPS